MSVRPGRRDRIPASFDHPIFQMREPPFSAATPAGGTPDRSLTRLLQSAESGDEHVLNELFDLVYDELHRLAHGVRRRSSSHTLCTTALVHEAYIKLVPSADVEWDSRAHFFGAAARAMRQILVSEARRRQARKRGGDDWVITFEEGAQAEVVRPDELIALDRALEQLAEIEPRRARVVESRFFAGLTTEEIARALDISTATVERDWRAARAWLTHQVANVALP